MKAAAAEMSYLRKKLTASSENGSNFLQDGRVEPVAPPLLSPGRLLAMVSCLRSMEADASAASVEGGSSSLYWP